jgi:hypothetical protein
MSEVTNVRVSGGKHFALLWTSISLTSDRDNIRWEYARKHKHRLSLFGKHLRLLRLHNELPAADIALARLSMSTSAEANSDLVNLA